MWLAELAREAYTNAVDKGFWEDSSAKSAIATKVALIHTEISELHEAVMDPDLANEIEKEGADIVIRAIDLAASLGFSDKLIQGIIDDIEEEYEEDPNKVPNAISQLLDMHYAASGITRADRRREISDRDLSLMWLIRLTFIFMHSLGVKDFESALRSKMEHNKTRPKMHGREY